MRRLRRSNPGSESGKRRMLYVQDLRLQWEGPTGGNSAVGSRVEAAAPQSGGGFSDDADVSLHCLRIHLERSYREALGLLSALPQILANIGLDAADLPDHSTQVRAVDRIEMAVWRVLLRLSAFTKAQRSSSPPERRGTREAVTVIDLTPKVNVWICTRVTESGDAPTNCWNEASGPRPNFVRISWKRSSDWSLIQSGCCSCSGRGGGRVRSTSSPPSCCASGDTGRRSSSARCWR